MAQLCRGESFCMFNTFDWEYLRSKISELDSTGTETDPSLITVPTISLIRESPLKYFESDLILSTNPKDYKKVLYVVNEKWQWDWTFDGLQHIKRESNFYRLRGHYHLALVLLYHKQPPLRSYPKFFCAH